MTTIAYRDGVLAADTLTNCGGMVEIAVRKIAAKRGIGIAAAGTSAMCQQFVDWATSGMNGEPPPAKVGESSYWGFLFPGGDRVVIWNEAGWLRGTSPYYAAGSGAEVALGAMAMGATADQAVSIAHRHDTRTGADVTVLRLEPGR